MWCMQFISEWWRSLFMWRDFKNNGCFRSIYFSVEPTKCGIILLNNNVHIASESVSEALNDLTVIPGNIVVLHILFVRIFLILSLAKFLFRLKFPDLQVLLVFLCDIATFILVNNCFISFTTETSLDILFPIINFRFGKMCFYIIM